jgi:hypothetical protein
LVLTLALAIAGTTLAQAPASEKFEGIVNDYYTDGGGTWHIAGVWSAEIKGKSGKSDFVASIAMVRTTGASPHTHHVGLFDATVLPAAGGSGYVIEGAATITGNGTLAGFSGSTVKVELTGGTAVLPSNLKITFQGGAAGHFGADPVDGVVTAVHP